MFLSSSFRGILSFISLNNTFDSFFIMLSIYLDSSSPFKLPKLKTKFNRECGKGFTV